MVLETHIDKRTVVTIKSKFILLRLNNWSAICAKIDPGELVIERFTSFRELITQSCFIFVRKLFGLNAILMQNR
jgi:hypothetical protein